MTLDYVVRVRDRASQELIAEQLDFAIRHGAIRGREAALAHRLIRLTVEQLLRRKRLSPEREARLRKRWEAYVA